MKKVVGIAIMSFGKGSKKAVLEVCRNWGAIVPSTYSSGKRLWQVFLALSNSPYFNMHYLRALVKDKVSGFLSLICVKKDTKRRMKNYN